MPQTPITDTLLDDIERVAANEGSISAHQAHALVREIRRLLRCQHGYIKALISAGEELEKHKRDRK